MSEWFDASQLIHDQPQPRQSENAPLYTVEYDLLSGAVYQGDAYYQKTAEFFQSMADVDPKGRLSYFQAPWLKERASHDNATALVSLAHFLRHNGQPDWRWDEIKIWGEYWHPRDIIYYGYVQRRWWAYPLLPILFGIYLRTCISEYKIRPTFIDWAKSGFKMERRKILKTDMEILLWIRMACLSHRKCMSLMAKLLKPLLKKRFGENYVHGMMNIYFGSEHPNTQLAETYGPVFK